MNGHEVGRVDLHLHSNRSDGIYAPRELIKIAALSGLKAAALTDHDTIDGLAEATAAGARLNFEVVPGVEISAYEDGVEVHLLGYYPVDLKALDEALQNLRRERYHRMERMVQRLNQLGFPVKPEHVYREAEPAAPGRLHLARHLVKQNMAGSVAQAFSQYLERGKPAYVPRANFTPAAALELLLECGAIPVLAHPGLHGKKLLPVLLDCGLKGIEVFHPEHSTAQRRFYRELAEKRGLLITGGSDFHGDKQYRASGPGSTTIPYHYLAQLKRAHCDRKV